MRLTVVAIPGLLLSFETLRLPIQPKMGAAAARPNPMQAEITTSAMANRSEGDIRS